MKRLLFWGLVVPALLRRLTPAWRLDPPLAVAARHPWLTLAVTAAALALGGLGIAASGIVPLQASAGHWAVTDWLLHFAMRRSIVTHALTIEAPPLDDPALVRRGAGHYDRGCSPCHGNVGNVVPQIPQAMLPPPPYLPPRISQWRPEELFYIVRHGVKFTGMPSWPAQQREDEVWAVVAFLRRLPGLSVDGYARLARGESTTRANVSPDAAPDVVRENCATCHGTDGLGRDGAFPTLAGQQAEYMDRALRAYADGRRHSGIMGPVAAKLNELARQEAVRHYASMAPGAPADSMARPSEQGAAIAESGVGDRIPACVACHGTASPAHNPAYPRLDGQHADYLVRQLLLFRARQRGGSEYAHLMHAFVDQLTEAQVSAVAAYFAARPTTARRVHVE